jgi:acyl-CoA synthetase (AMP-forming)/AMP-acid ligase II
MRFVVDRFEEAVKNNPQQIAIRSEDRYAITYEELNQQADRASEFIVSVLALDDIDWDSALL